MKATYEQLLEQLARHRRAMQAAAGRLNKTGGCTPEESAQVGRMLWGVASATGEKEIERAARALEEIGAMVNFRFVSSPPMGISGKTAASALRALRPVRAYTCSICGAGFRASDTRAKYCSNRCRQAAKRRRQKKRGLPSP